MTGHESETVSLRDYVDAQIKALDERIDARLNGMDRADAVANLNLSEWKHSANEFRGALSDSSTRMISRPEHEKLVSDVVMLQTRGANLDGRMTIMAAAVSIVTSLLTGGLLMAIERLIPK